MGKTWLSSVVAGLLVLAPIAAVAQSGAQEAEEQDVETTQEAGTTEVLDADLDETGTLKLVDETETDDVPGEDGDDPAGDSNDHGERVSAVARCAPTGQLTIDGFANHGAFVRAVAKGETVTVEGTEYDLSTQEGVDALCAWAETYEHPDGTAVEVGTHDRGRPEGAGKPDHAGPPAHAGDDGEDDGEAAAGTGQEGSEVEDAEHDGGPPAHAGRPAGVGDGNGNAAR